MANPASMIRDLLITDAVGVDSVTADWSVFLFQEPETPDAVITVYNAGGEARDPKWGLDFPSIQVRVRGKPGDYTTAYTKISDVVTALLGRDPETVQGDEIQAFNMLGDIIQLGFDQSNRPLLVVNFRLIIEPTLPGGSHRTAIS